MVAAESMVGLETGAGPTIVDVNSFNFNDGSEPSIAINPVSTNEIVINGGFGGWGTRGNQNVEMFMSTDGGATWSLNSNGTVSPPTGITAGLAGCPCDTTIDFGRLGVFSGTFLAGPTGAGADDNLAPAVPTPTATPKRNSIYSGTSTGLSSASNWEWFAPGGVAQLTNSLNVGSNPDQPQLLVNRDPVIAAQGNTYVAYDDFSAGPVDMRVAVATGTNPPSFVRDQSTGSSAGAINPGNRLAVDPTNGWIYDLFQNCPATNPGCNVDGTKDVQYILNRSTDGGLTWTLNGSATGVIVGTGTNTQPRPKFGTVNALLGGIDHVAVDPNTSKVYVVYGDTLGGNQRIVIRQLTPNSTGGLTIGLENPVSIAGVNSALPSVAVAGGTVGVLYTAFDKIDPATNLPQFTAHFATSTNGGVSFTDQMLLTFLSPSMDDGGKRQRVLGDYQQLRAVGLTFYGVFTGNGAALGRAEASSDPIFFTVAAAPSPTPTPTTAPTATPTIKVTATPTAQPAATPTPVPGAKVSASPVQALGVNGQTVAGGSFTVQNTLGIPETISSATLTVSHPTLFSSLTLSTTGQSVRLSPPGATNTFTFTTPVSLPVGGSVAFSLNAVISMNPVMLNHEFKYAALAFNASVPISRSAQPLAEGFLLLGFALLALPCGTRRRAIVIAVLAIGLGAAAVGCGGGGGNVSLVASFQKVTALNITASGRPVGAAGLPASLGSISS